MIFVNNNSTDYKGYTRNLGEIFYPIMKLCEDFVRLEYNTISTKVCIMNTDL